MYILYRHLSIKTSLNNPKHIFSYNFLQVPQCLIIAEVIRLGYHLVSYHSFNLFPASKGGIVFCFDLANVIFTQHQSHGRVSYKTLFTC